MPTISQYYSTKNNQTDNLSSLPVNFDHNSSFVLAAEKVGHSHETIKQPISLKLQPIHLTTELLGPLMTAKLNFASGWLGIAELTLAPKKVVMPMPWFTQAKDI